jgi:hypothetical protein
MYLFHKSTPETDTLNARSQRGETCEHWAEGSYALYVAHQFKAWPLVWDTWSGAAQSDFFISDLT